MKTRVSQQACMLKEIMSYGFTAIDLNLFLDTHPGDVKALTEYNCVTQTLGTLIAAYEQCYGPLTAAGHTPSQYPWQWIDEPWPWQIEF